MARGAGKGRLFEGGDYFTYFRKRGAIIRGRRLIENLFYCLAKQVLVFLGIKEANFCRFPAALLLASFFGRSMNFLVPYSETSFPRKLHLKSEFAQIQTSSILFNFI